MHAYVILSFIFQCSNLTVSLEEGVVSLDDHEVWLYVAIDYRQVDQNIKSLKHNNIMLNYSCVRE